ncbi:MAG: signal recognition particle-docking protein FtsY [Clostridia bacterium]|nr:signal recognition particle-docking protein FtsY [Clostridia bacterium]
MGFFSKIANALKKTKDAFSSKFTKLFARDKIGEDFYEDLEDILISSDISFSTSEDIVEELRDRMIEGKVSDKDVVVEELKDILIDKLNDTDDFDFEYPCIIMIVGVNGVGKTTSIGKLANKFRKEHKTITIAAADTFRAAASDQLEVWAKRADVRIIKQSEGCDPSAVVYDAVNSAKTKKTDVLIIDTAGRLHVKSNLMEELKKMNRVVDREFPEANFYKMIVLDSTTGQNAYSQVDLFNQAIGLDGIILTKLDGTAKGGFVISLADKLKVPVKFVGVGEGIDDIEDFDSEEFVEALF